MVRLLASGLALVMLAVGTVACSEPSAPSLPLRVLVVGGAASASDGSPAWPQLLESDGNLSVEADIVEGSGWTTASPGAVRDRVAGADVDVIVLALGETDADAAVPDALRDAVVRDGISAAVESAPTVLVVPPLTPRVPGSPAESWRESLSIAVGEIGAAYVDVVVPGVGSDPPRLDAEAHRSVAERIGEVLGGLSP